MKRLSLKCIAYLVPMLPMLVYFRIPFTSYSLTTVLNMALACYVIFALILSRDKIFISKLYLKYLALVLWTLFITFIKFVSAKYNVDIGISELDIISIAILILGLFTNVFESNKILKGYSFLVKLNIVATIIQLAFYIFAQKSISLICPFFPLSDDYPTINTFGTVSDMKTFELSGLFSERSHSAVFMIPYLCICMERYVNKKSGSSLRSMIVLSVAIIATGSGNGVIGCALAWLFYAFLVAKNKKQYWIFGAGILILSVTYMALIRIPEFNEMFSTLFYNSNEYSRSKADLRIYRGFEAYGDLPILDKIFGIGYREFVSYAKSVGYHTSFDRGQFMEYMNCIAQILVYSGLIGFISFITFGLSLYKRSGLAGKLVCFSFLAIAMSSSVYYDVTWILYFSIIISLLIKNKTEVKNEKG